MIIPTDGPARGETLMLARAPDFLRVVFSRARGWNGLDEPTDEPRADEDVYAYRRVGAATRGMVDYVDRKGRRRGECVAVAKYLLVENQPDGVTLRSTVEWQAWCIAQKRAARAAASPPLTMLVDGDGVAWRAAYHAADGAAAAANAQRWIQKTAAELFASRTIVCLGDPSRRYFRHELFEGYKPRATARPALVTDAIVGMEDAYLSRWLPGLEADDVCGILATAPGLEGERVIVSDDKDMLTVPGRLCRQGKLFDISPAEAGARHLLQTLVGDSGDGYPGCPGVGPKKAEQVVSVAGYAADPAGAWRSLVWTFERAGRTAADALLQARLARILRHEDYDIASRTVRPWLPPELAAMRMAGVA